VLRGMARGHNAGMKTEAIEELLSAARETLAWPFKRRRAFLDRLEAAVKRVENEKELNQHATERDPGTT
jgi:hypothetical protein